PLREVGGGGGTGEETLRLAEELRPDVVLLDIGMPGESGIETVRRLKAKLPALKVLFLTMHEEEGMLLEALNAGADGYLIKRADEAEIIQAIRVVQRGDVY